MWEGKREGEGEGRGGGGKESIVRREVVVREECIGTWIGW